jgi:protein-S-isoprenylcysteine O-methyltransferase Ste14
MKNPKMKIWVQLVVGTIFLALMIFLSAGTIHYWQAWVYLGLSAVLGISLVRYIASDPVLLESRTKVGPIAEKRPIQKVIVAFGGIAILAVFIVPGFDHRFGWSSVPAWLAIVGDLLIMLGMWMVYRVFRENSFGSATIEVARDQKVISTGPYATVRNPMYSSAVVYLIGVSLALGSYWGLIASALTVLGLVLRLFDEERFLRQNLPGYTEYCAGVRWHLVPKIF